MNNLEKNLSLLEEKIVSKMDLDFISKIKIHLAFWNPYFLVCFSEVIHQVNDNPNIFDDLDSNISFLDLISYLNKKAKIIYLNSNISEYISFGKFEAN